ncbi:MAG: hypothetical protein ACLGHE_09640 [Gammaproteobacteria bacterium]
MHAATPHALPRSLSWLPALLVVLVTLLQLSAWTGLFSVTTGSHNQMLLSGAEMLLIAALVWNGWRIRQHVARLSLPTEMITRLRTVATLTLASLAICSLGDLVNRNFSQTFFTHDTIIKHSYLADSVWFFFPGYALFVLTAWFVTRDRVTLWLRIASLGVAGVAGLASFAGLVLPGTSPYVTALTGSYAVLISLMVPVALWLVTAFGRRVWPVALGAVLATAADTLIGQFWLFGEGYYPGVAYLNLVVYFLSQALLQQLPLYLAIATDASAKTA